MITPTIHRKQNSIRLSAVDIAKLNAEAGRTNSLAKAGSNAGKPSWRAMLMDIAAGRVTTSLK